jgi:hypothetical protein
MSEALPPRPHLNWLRNRAKEKLESLRAANPAAQLSDAQFAAAKDYGFANWRLLKQHVDAVRAALPDAAEVDRFAIDGVPMLAWGKSGETTFCGALAAALAVTDRPVDYATLMGDTGLALRTRWYRTDDPANPIGWCNSSPVGEFSPWTDLAAKCIGWSIRFQTFIPGYNVTEPVDMSRFVADVIDSIDAGLPVLCYPRQLDVGLIHGYENAGQALLARSYYESQNADFIIAPSEIKGMRAFLTDKTERPTRRESIIIGLRQMVEDFSRPPVRTNRDGREGEYRFGRHGYKTWIDDLRTAGEMSAQHQANLFRAGWWAFDVLADARFTAVGYLTQSAEALAGPAPAALLGAAEALGPACKALGGVFAAKDAFFGPWSGKGVSDWTADARARETAVLTTAMDCDARAVEQIASALAKLE